MKNQFIDSMQSLIVLTIITFSIILLPTASAESFYIYVEELPAWADYAVNVMYDSTQAWQDANPGLVFYLVDDPLDADFTVQWVKEFAGERVGYAYGSEFIEVGLGDSRCNEQWNPYSANHISHIMKHEMGHIFGHEHNDDPNSLMYPIALNKEYGIVESETTLTNNYAHFLLICTAKDITTFDWSVVSDDPTYGFDVFFVPSSEEFDKWVNGESFSYFDDEGCFANNMLSASGTCKGVTIDSGLLVIMGDTVTNPLTQISLNFQENLQSNVISKEQTKSLPSIPTSTAPLEPINTTFSLFVDPDGEFSIKYPSTWTIYGEKNQEFKISFADNYDWTSQLTVMHYENVDYTGFTKNEIFNDVFKVEQEYCNNVTLDIDGFICYNFKMLMADMMILDSVYFYGFSDTRQYDSVSGIEYLTTTILMDVPDGDTMWSVYSETDSNSFDAYYLSILTSLESFKILQTSDAPSTTKIVNPLPLSTIDNPKEIASFVDESKDPQSYIDRYNNEPTYKTWFDKNYPQYSSIEQAVGLTQKIPSWVKNVFGWYDRDLVTEDELLDAIKYLIDEKILKIN